jgi:lysophospholipase L1-like esterase
MTVALPAPNASSAGSSEIQLDTLQTVTFSGNESILIPDGSLAVSDPLRFPVAPQSELSISIYLANGQQGNSITSHPGSRINIFYSFCDYTRAFNLTDPSTQSVAHWYFLSAVEAWTPPQSSAFNIVGDSITDGRGSTTDENNRWPDLLYARMAQDPATSDIAVINEAAGGNCILTDGPTTGCLGPNALGRLDRDVLAQSGVKYAMIFEGVNDIGTASTNATAQDEIYNRLIQAYEQMITRVHTFGIPFFGATITPFMAPNSTIQPYSQPAYDVTRQRVNAWIRTSGKFDAVFDFDAVVRDRANPQQIAPQYNSGDYLHMNPAGYQAIADSIDLGVFQQFANGVNGFTR